MPAVNIPEIQSVECTDLTYCSATLKAVIVNMPPDAECGFRYGTDMDLSGTNSQTVSAIVLDSGSVSAGINGLSPSTTYYYQAYVRRADLIISSEVKSFTTLLEIPEAPEAVDLEAVDLGLSIKWSNLNLGAIRPEYSGDLFAWGETETRSSYTWDGYKFSVSPSRVYKYCIDENMGVVDYRIYLEAGDDAASVGIISEWRVPTREEWQELKDMCDWEWISNYDGTHIPGYIIKGRGEYSDRSIFLPEGSNSHSLLSTLYWSSSLDKTNSLNAHCLSMDKLTSMTRSSGMMIRPVCGEPALPAVESISFVTDDLNVSTFNLDPEEMLGYGAYFKFAPDVVRDDDLIISSSDPSVATAVLDNLYSHRVTIYVKGYGTTEITAVTVDGGLKAVYNVTITCPPVDMIDGTKVSFRVPKGEVDLGLSVIWSNYNLGADAYYLKGNSYQWGHIMPNGVPDSTNVNCYNHFGNYVGNGSNSWEAYKHCEGTMTTLTRYNTSSYYGKVDNLRILLPEDDAATAALGEGWRTATFAEWDELRTHCTWTFIKNYNGSERNAYKVTSNVPGYEDKFIILDASRHWTSELQYGHPIGAINYCWSLAEDGIFFHGTESMVRVESASIRPVRDF